MKDKNMDKKVFIVTNSFGDSIDIFDNSQDAENYVSQLNKINRYYKKPEAKIVQRTCNDRAKYVAKKLWSVYVHTDTWIIETPVEDDFGMYDHEYIFEIKEFKEEKFANIYSTVSREHVKTIAEEYKRQHLELKQYSILFVDDL